MARDLKMGTQLNEKTGRLVALSQGIPVVLAGMIERNGGGYRVQVRQLAPDKEEPVSVARADAPDKAQVLGAVARVAEDLREALGDTTPSSTQQKETFTAASLEAVRAYTEAQDLSTSQRDVEAAEKYREALRHDPEFGRAYSGLGASLFRMGNRDEAEKNWNEALRRTDRMTEREKLRTYRRLLHRHRAKYRQGDRDLRAAGREIPGGFGRLQQPGDRLFQHAQFRQGARIRPQGHRHLSEDLQIPIELRPVRDVRRRLQDRGGDRPGADQGRSQGRRPVPAARDGSGRGRGYPAGAHHV